MINLEIEFTFVSEYNEHCEIIVTFKEPLILPGAHKNPEL